MLLEQFNHVFVILLRLVCQKLTHREEIIQQLPKTARFPLWGGNLLEPILQRRIRLSAVFGFQALDQILPATSRPTVINPGSLMGEEIRGIFNLREGLLGARELLDRFFGTWYAPQ